jgi:hypothetical protein
MKTKTKCAVSLLLVLMLSVLGFPLQGLEGLGGAPTVMSPIIVNAATEAGQPSGWAAEQVNAAIALGLVPVNLQSNYQNPITHAEFTALAVALYETVTGNEITERATFDDSDDINVQKMGGLGIVSGVGNGYFNPNDTLTREQAAAILVRLANAVGQPLPSSVATFADNNQMSSWATNAAGQIQSAGIMSGTGNNMFSPQAHYTREQSIATILRLGEFVGGIPMPTPPRPTPQPPVGSPREFDMNDPNVQAFSIFATARTAEELRAGDRGWQSAAEIKVDMHDTHPDRLVDGMTVYEWRFKPIFAWVDNYLATNRIDIAGMTDYEKTTVIRQIIEDGRLEEFIGLWQPNFRFGATGRGNCVSRAHAVQFMLIAMDFELFRLIGGHVNLSHAWNAYWYETVGGVRFVDADLGFGVWNIFIDELAARNFIIDQ